MDQVAKAELLRALHKPGDPHVLVNAWDAASARVVVRAGAPAVATSSAAAAYALGYPDGERISRDEMLGYVATIARAVDVPVTADMEAGYGPSREDAAATARDSFTSCCQKRRLKGDGKPAHSAMAQRFSVNFALGACCLTI